MLVLSRSRDEVIVIGDYEVVITVVEIRGDRVRLGIKAGKDIPIHRLEIKQLIDKEAGKDAAQDAGQGCSGPERLGSA